MTCEECYEELKKHMWLHEIVAFCEECNKNIRELEAIDFQDLKKDIERMN